MKFKKILNHELILKKVQRVINLIGMAKIIHRNESKKK